LHVRPATRKQRGTISFKYDRKVCDGKYTFKARNEIGDRIVTEISEKSRITQQRIQKGRLIQGVFHRRCPQEHIWRTVGIDEAQLGFKPVR
jgi:hypothetical protein